MIATSGVPPRRLAAFALLAFGLLSILAGGGIVVQAARTAEDYASSADAQRHARQLDELDTRPLWIDGRPVPAPPADGDALPLPRAGEGQARSASVRELQPGAASPALAPNPATPDFAALLPTLTPERLAAPDDIEIAVIAFRFEDPPEPGARAHVAVTLRNRSDAPSGPLTLAIPKGWFDGYRAYGAIPDALDDRLGNDGLRHFDFAGLEPLAETVLQLHVVATDEDLRGPEVAVSLRGGPQLARAQPRTEAPRPRPGPARAVSIPSLGLKSSVVPTVWEPPPFVVGQIRGSANLSEGNTILVGHLNGLEGNVFANLEKLKLGDEVIAVSRGLEYRFVVSELTVLTNVDSGPMQQTAAPRLSLMTCTGLWNPFTHDYSHRLWVVAEPEEQARLTIAANATATALAPTATPTDEPTPEPTGTPAPSATPEARVAGRRAERAPGAAATATRPPALGEAGLRITHPTPDARVPAGLLVKGTRTLPIDPGLHAWLFVRAEVEGSRWYVYPKQLEAKSDGAWELEFELGGPPNIRHTLQVGVVDAETHELLTRHVRRRQIEPFEELPPGFFPEHELTVIRR